MAALLCVVVPYVDPHTQIANGLEQLVMLTRMTFPDRDGGLSAMHERILPS